MDLLQELFLLHKKLSFAIKRNENTLGDILFTYLIIYQSSVATVYVWLSNHPTTPSAN